MYFYKGDFSGVPITFAFRHSETANHYNSWLRMANDAGNAVTIPEKDILHWHNHWNVKDYAYAEYILSCGYACDYLMNYQRIVFHGAAFQWNEKAYIFTAPSGTGKTTQLNLWKSLYPDEVIILNGDKPILEINDSQILVHPSPWKGKEGMGRDDIIAPLGGIIFLQQSKENDISRMNQSEAVMKMFGRFYSTFSTPDEVMAAGRMLETMLNNVPVWLLKNKGDRHSAVITHQLLRQEQFQ